MLSIGEICLEPIPRLSGFSLVSLLQHESKKATGNMKKLKAFVGFIKSLYKKILGYKIEKTNRERV
jgi:hypothetical protein